MIWIICIFDPKKMMFWICYGTLNKMTYVASTVCFLSNFSQCSKQCGDKQIHRRGDIRGCK